MDYIEILKKSALYIWKHKFLWLLGFLITSGSVAGSGNYSYGTEDFDNNIEKIENSKDVVIDTLFGADAKVSSVGKVMGDSINSTVADNMWLWIFLAAFFVVLVLIGIYLKVTAKGAIIWAIDAIDKKKDVNLKKSWIAGHRYFFRMLSLIIIIFLIVAIPFLVLSIPVAVFAIFDLTILAVILGIVFSLVFLVYAIYLALILPYSERYLVLRNDRAMKSISNCRKLFSKKWGEILIMYLLMFVMYMVVASVVMMVALVAMLPLIVVGIALLLFGPIIIAIYIGLIVLIIFLISLVVTGIINSYFSSVITLTFKELVK